MLATKFGSQMSRPRSLGRYGSYSSRSNISLYEFASSGIHADAAGAVNCAIGDDGLIVYPF